VGPGFKFFNKKNFKDFFCPPCLQEKMDFKIVRVHPALRTEGWGAQQRLIAKIWGNIPSILS
jgi:hypothetical protein